MYSYCLSINPEKIKCQIVFAVFLFYFGLVIPYSWASDDLLDVLRKNRTINQKEYEALKKEQRKSKQSPLKKGLIFASPDGDFKFRIGGRLMVDGAYYDNNTQELGNGTKIRRGRVFIKGKMYQDYKFKVQYDFADNLVSVKDVYIQYTGLDSSVITIGNFKETFSLEELTSSKYSTFMEPGLPNAFTPGRHIGVGFMTHGYNWTFGVGAFGEGPGDERVNDEGYGFSSRVTFAPINNKNQSVHLGLAGAYRVPESLAKTVTFDSRPESDVTTKKLVATGDITNVESYANIGVEAAVVKGPWSIQGEYIYTNVNRGGTNLDPQFHGFYTYLSWLITGESRPYSAINGEFGRIKPKNNFGKGGSGAWEVAVRYSGIDLDDRGVNGGNENDLTLGLNWYLNPNMRLMANYVLANINSPTFRDDINILQMRAQIDF